MSIRILIPAAAFILLGASIGLEGDAAAPRNADRTDMGAACSGLSSLRTATASVTSAELVPAGEFHSPRQTETSNTAYDRVPTFCRVQAAAVPLSGSRISIEIWLPVAGWNGKLEAVGNTGWGGVISYKDMAAAVTSGFAAAATDTGHKDTTAGFGIGHPEQLIDYSYRAMHETAVEAKAVAAAYYGHAVTVSIFNGCSYGGHQGLTEATRYPKDFDGIIAGDPSLNWRKLNATRVALYAEVHRGPDSYIPPAKYRLIHDAALKACHAQNGVIEHPLACHFDPVVLACKSGDASDCLTPAQVKTAQLLYGPMIVPSTGDVLEPRFLLPGSELGWSVMAGPSLMSTPLTAYVKAEQPDWDLSTFNPATDLIRLLQVDPGLKDFDDTDAKALAFFFHRGGKLLMYHGWADASVPAMGSVEYFEHAQRQLGTKIVGKSMQLYMVPGMGHCGGGAGTDTFDKMAAMEHWLSTGHAPKCIPATHVTGGVVDRTGTVCAYSAGKSGFRNRGE